MGRWLRPRMWTWFGPFSNGPYGAYEWLRRECLRRAVAPPLPSPMPNFVQGPAVIAMVIIIMSSGIIMVAG